MSNSVRNAPPAGDSAMPRAWKTWASVAGARWQSLAARERQALIAAGLVLGLFLLWSLGIQPAWRTLRDSPAQIEKLGMQLQTMQRLAAEAAELQGTAALSAAQAGAGLQASAQRLGSKAKLALQGDRATVTVTGLSGEELSDWLADVRSAARARTLEAQLTRDSRGYSGTVVLGVGADR